MGQRFGRTVKSVAPEWLINELKRDVHYVKRKFSVVKDVALLDFLTFKDIVADMNSIMRRCCIEDHEQVIFGVRTVDEDVFWKAHVKIICLKIDKQERTFSVMRCMNLHQFWSLRAGLLRELQMKNALCEGVDEFVFVNVEDCDDSIPSTSTSTAIEETVVTSPHPLTVSTVLHRVDEYGGLETGECLICLDKKVDVSLPCAHSFCSFCISKWVDESGSCPTCRDEVKSPEELWEFTEIPNIAQINRQLIDFATGT